MSQSDRTVKLTVDIQGKVNDLEGQLGKVQKQLSKLKMPDNIANTANKSVESLENKINNIRNKTKGNKINLLDEKEIRKEITEVEKEFQGLFKLINNNSKNINLANGFKTSLKEVKALTSAIDKYYDSIKAHEKEIKDLTAERQKAEKSKTNIELKRNATLNRKSQYDSLISERNRLQERVDARIAEYQKSGKTEGQAKAYASRTKEGKELAQILERLTGLTEDYDKKLQNLDKQYDEANEKVKHYQSQIDKLSSSLDALKSDNFNTIIKELSTLQANGDIKLDFDPNTIKNIDELKEKLREIDEQDLSKLNSALDDLLKATNQGENGAKNLNSAIEESVKETKELDSQLNNLKTKIAYFFGLENAINLFKRAVRSAFETVKDLDAVMTETAVVTDFSVGDMWNQLPEYTRRANELGVSIHDAYEAATLYYQQGLSTNEVMAVSNETLKMARIAGLDAADATDRMTNALRGFNMEITEANAQNINDVYSNLAAKTASDVDEISVAMTKVASLAHNANMSFENTAAFLSQIIETTRESAETAGTALKTVVARFSEVKELHSKGELLGLDTEGEEIDVNKVSKALRSAGINLNEYLTGAKGLDDIFMELSAKWDSLDQVQQRYIATMAAGSRQQSRFIALMQDNARMTELVGEANNSAGASQKQFEKTLDSLETKLNRLKDAWDTFLMTLANNEAIKGVVDILTEIIGHLNKLLEVVGKVGGSWAKSIVGIGTIFGGLRLAKKGGNKLFGDIGTALGITKKQGEGAGEEVANGIIEGAENGLNNQKESFKDKIKSFFTITEKVQVPVEIKDLDKNSFKEIYFNNFNDDTVSEIIDKTGDLFNDEQKASIEDLNKALKECGVAEKDLIPTTVKLSEAQTKTKVSALAVGVVMTTVGGILSNASGIWGQLGSAVTSAGVAMTSIGGIAQALGKSIGPVGMGISAAIGIAGFALKKFLDYKAKNSPEEQLKRAQEAAEKAEKAVETATESYNKLKDSLTELKEVNSSIDDLIVGTTEWKEAIQESNQQIIELISNYGQLAGYVKNENGRLILDTESSQVQDILNEKNRAVNVAQIYQLSTKQDVLAKTNTKLAKDASIAGIGTEEMMDIAKAAAGDAESLEKFGVELEDALNFLSNEELQSLGQNILANEQKIEALNAAIASSITNLGDLDEEQSKYVSSLLNNGAFDRYKEAVSGSYKDWSSEDLQQELTEQMGYLTYDDLLKARGVESYSDEEIRSELENIKATDEATKSLKAFSIGVSKSTDLTKRVFSQENGLGLTKADVNALKNEVAEVVKSGGDFIDEKFKEIYGRTPTEEDRNSNEYKNIQYQYDAAITGADAVFSEIEEKLNILPNSLKNSIIGTEDEVAALSTLDAKNYQEITDSLLTVFSASGEAAAEKIITDFNEITAQGVDANQLASALNMIDWKNLDDIEGLPDILKDVGIEIPTPELEKFINDLKDGAQAIRNINLETLIQNITDLGLISKNIREGKQDRTFSEEDYNKLISADSSLAGSFTKNLEGEFVFVGDKMEILTKAIDENTAALLGEAEKQLEAKIGVNDLLAASDIGSTKVSYKGGTPSDVFVKGDLSDRNDWKEEDRRKALESIIKQANIQGTDLSQLGIADLSNNTTMGSLSDERISQILDQLYTISQNQKDYETQLEKLREDAQVQEHLSKNTASENAQLGIEGDTAATSALKVQAAEAGVTEEVINELFAQIEEGSKSAIFELGEVTSMFKQLGDLDIDVEEVQHLSDEIQKTNKALNKTAAAELAIMNIKLNKGIQQIADSFEDWTRLIDKNTGTIKANVAEDSEVFNDLKESVNMMLNTAQPLSDAFWNDAQNITLLQEAAQGSTEALEALQKAAAKDYILSLKVDDTAANMQLNHSLDNFADLIENVDLPDVEPGMNLNMFDEGVRQFVEKCNAMLASGATTVQQMSDMWKGLGYDTQYKITGWKTVESEITYVHGAGSYGADKEVKKIVHKLPEYSLDIITKGGNVSSSFTPPPTSSSSGQSGSSSGSEKNPTWDNPYDELYNHLEKINELERQKIKLEREFDKALNSTNKTNGEIAAAFQDQKDNLEAQIEAQETLANKRLETVQKLNKASIGGFRDDEGNYRSYSTITDTKNRHLNDLAQYNEKTKQMEINWEEINKFKYADNEQDLLFAKALESYVSELEKLSSSYEEAVDKQEDLQYELDNLGKEYIKSFADFNDRIVTALITQREKEIEKLEQMSDAIKDASDKVISGIREQVEKERQARQNEKTEEELAQKEARLEYLRRDTSGANQNEILQLEKEVEEARQSYEDTLVDQAIDKLQEDANLAAEQRANQIDVMNAQLEIEKENGGFLREAYKLFDAGIQSDNSPLIRLLQDTEGFKSMSHLGQIDWKNEMAEAFHEALLGLKVTDTTNEKGWLWAQSQPKYASGGLADFTGPAWLDGTKSKPELVLNAEDTRNFLALNDILGSLLSSNNTITNNNGGGDNYYTIEIDAVLGSDYDVDQLAARLKQKIVEDSSYRNVNSIGFIR